MSGSQETCPNCGGTLHDLKCGYCEITYVRCSCGHLNPTWVNDCPYCHASEMPSRAVELNEDARSTAVDKSRDKSFYQRMRMLDAQAVEKAEAANTAKEAKLMPPPAPAVSEPPPEEKERLDYITEQIDPLELQEREAQRIRDFERKRRQDERLNPNFVYQQSLGPAVLFTIGVLWIYAIGRASTNLETLLPAYTLIGIAAIWLIVIFILDRIRPV